MMVAVLQINSGIDRNRIIYYLEQESGLTAEQDGSYHLPGCTITVTPLVSTHAVLKIPRTLVTFSGDEAACRTQQQKFRLRFLSAGG